MFKDKILLITGGTGSFGNAVLRQFLESNIAEIRIFSRDENKQNDMRNKYQNSKIKFYVGDVREHSGLENAMNGVDFVLHAAALKQVPSCEFFPSEAVRTNVLGTENMLDVAIKNNVKKIVCLSTDKAVYPINAMGMTKAVMEKVAVARARLSNNGSVISVTRYGNVMCSRGSVIPLFVNQIRAGKALTVTDPKMTRFMMSLDDAIDLVLFAFEHATGGELYIQKAPASTIDDLAEAMRQLFGQKEEIHYIGTRHGEKLHESLLAREEMAKAVDFGRYYMVAADNRDLNYGNYLESGKESASQSMDYTSHNTTQLSLDEIKDLLLSLEYVRNAIDGKHVGDGY